MNQLSIPTKEENYGATASGRLSAAEANAIVNKINELIVNVVLAVEGKGLSTNDFTTALLNKLNAISAGATANSTDAQLRDRATHTGQQLSETISDFESAVNAILGETTNQALSTSSAPEFAGLSVLGTSATITKTTGSGAGSALFVDTYAGANSACTVLNLAATNSVDGGKYLLNVAFQTPAIGAGSLVPTVISVRRDAGGTLAYLEDLTDLQESYITDSDIITAIVSATYNSAGQFTASISPAAGKVMKKGKFYKAGHRFYSAVADNVVYRFPNGEDIAGLQAQINDLKTDAIALKIFKISKYK